MKEYYVCDECKKLMKQKDEIMHVIGSKGELYFCKKCAKDYVATIKAK